MVLKSQRLANMRKEMYENIESIKKDYPSYTPLEKAKFVLEAFNSVNSYCCEKWGMKEDESSFCFEIGANNTACASYIRDLGPSIAFNLEAAMTIEDPYAIYKVLFHEMKHIHQAIAQTPGEVLFALYPKYFTTHQTKDRWLASPRETESDDFAFRELIKISKQGLLKSDVRVKDCEQVEFFKDKREKSFFMHVKGVGRSAVDVFKSIFGSKYRHSKQIENYIGCEMNGGIRCINFGTVAEIINSLPYKFDHISKLQGNPFRDYTNARGSENFSRGAYFIVLRESNKQANRIALENYENGNIFQISDAQRESMELAKQKDMNAVLEMDRVEEFNTKNPLRRFNQKIVNKFKEIVVRTQERIMGEDRKPIETDKTSSSDSQQTDDAMLQEKQEIETEYNSNTVMSEQESQSNLTNAPTNENGEVTIVEHESSISENEGLESCGSIQDTSAGLVLKPQSEEISSVMDSGFVQVEAMQFTPEQ